MKLFQQLLVAPAALGLMAPFAVNAAELNINDVSDYSASSESVQNFSDIYPADWAHKALTSLAERSGCAVSTPSGSITRYEAAALLNKCLGDVAQVSEEEQRLLQEFGPELAVIKGRLDGLEARIGEYEAGAFSSTTKLTGKVVFNTGALDTVGQAENNPLSDDKLTFEYVAQYNLYSSFSGKDQLYTRIKAGSGSGGHWESTSQGTHLAASHDQTNLEIDKLWYSFPVGDNFTVWVGPAIENYYMLASSPSIYKPVMKAFALGGNAATYGSSTGPGFGFAWTQTKDDASDPRFAFASNYTNSGGASNTYGLLGDKDSKWLSKLEYGTPQYQVSVAYATNTCLSASSCKSYDSYYTTTDGSNQTGTQNALAVRAYWQPEENRCCSFNPSWY